MRRLIVLLFFTLVFYGGSLKFGFSQDDFFFLTISQATSLRDVLLFFSPWHQAGFPFFRPLGTQLYYFVFTGIFDNPQIYMHIFMILVHSFNAYLVVRLLDKIIPRRNNLIWGILYASSSLHFLSLYYIAATQQLISTFFSLASILAYANKKPILPAILFFLALLSKETALVVPGIIFLFNFLCGSSPPRLKTILRSLALYALVVAIYLALRLSADLVIQDEYKFIFGPSVLSTLRWYILFTAGVPEILLSYGASAGSLHTAKFLSDHGVTGFFSLIPGLIALIIIAGSTLSSLRKSYLSWRDLIILSLWWVLGILLVIFLPQHRYPHYLDISLVALLILSAKALERSAARFVVAILLLTNSLFGIALSEATHWTTGRALAVEKITSSLVSQEFCTKKAVKIVGDSNLPTEAEIALSKEKGPRYICNASGLAVYYGALSSPGGTPEFEITKNMFER